MKKYSDFFEAPKPQKSTKKNVRLKPKNKSRNNHGPRPQSHTENCTLYHLPPKQGHVSPYDDPFANKPTSGQCTCK